MSVVNPVVLIQLMINYYMQTYEAKKNGSFIEPRTFVFQKNNRLRVHQETPEEVMRRKSLLSVEKSHAAETAIREQLSNVLKGRAGKVWIDPRLRHLAIPLETATGNSRYGVLPTGSRIKIPEGKFIRAFTYWEKVNDIDLSVFALTEDGRQEEFSWRNMYEKQSEEIAYSGDQTSGYNGGSEYFDINIEEFKKKHSSYRYLIFCNNVYSGFDFSQCECLAGFMSRDIPISNLWKGERRSDPMEYEVSQHAIFDPKTVDTSYRINANGTFAYLFAIDLVTREMVWLNLVRSDRLTIAGTSDMKWLKKYLIMDGIFNITDLYRMAGELVNDTRDADIIVSDNWKDTEGEEKEVVHSWDFEKMLSLLKAG